MTPTLHPGDLLWFRKTRTFQRGQIALVRQDETELKIKRIVGLPSESVSIRAGNVSINEQPFSEPYVPPTAHFQPQSDCSWMLGPGQFIVLGDARDDSLDSRRLGPVHLDQIVGIAGFRLWPLPFRLR
jgi:signal peptidase I